MYNNVIFQLDGSIVSDAIISKFDLRAHSRNLRYSSRVKADVLDFVGFVIKDDNILVVLPKHYTDPARIPLLNDSDMALLFKTLLKKQINYNLDYIGEMEYFESSYPFNAFFEVYKYFKNYGLYHETNTIIKPGNNGKISWKDTIRKSQVIINEKNVIFSPLYIKRNYTEEVFLTECMAYVINKTIRVFSSFINLKSVQNINIHEEAFENKDYVVSKLRVIATRLFKDKEKKLIKALIEYFENKNQGGNIVFKHYNFELVWESVVNEFLNKHLSGIKDGFPNFDLENRNIKRNFSKGRFYINNSNGNHRIEPDHYYIDGDNQYILDSKYYTSLSNIDYKQIAYNTILRSQVDGETYNALFLPTHEKINSSLYFDLNESYYNDKGIKIIATYLTVKDSMEVYVASN
ncbi:hypothetical protein [Lysinibacillus sp. NPDC056185]|uniref:hypothetical protein n=1 Tax=Lysinibacillus sp. NPDC056185 TaxID=3345739 RepID=UPI0039EFC89C